MSCEGSNLHNVVDIYTNGIKTGVSATSFSKSYLSTTCTVDVSGYDYMTVTVTHVGALGSSTTHNSGQRYDVRNLSRVTITVSATGYGSDYNYGAAATVNISNVLLE